MNDRQTGRTSRALRQFDHLCAQRRGAVYVIGRADQISYTLRLARSLDLHNIRRQNIISVAAAGNGMRLRGLYRSDVVLDHAALETAGHRDADRLLNELDLLASITVKAAP